MDISSLWLLYRERDVPRWMGGRMPIRGLVSATLVLDKYNTYEEEKDSGIWIGRKNRKIMLKH